MPLRQSRGLLAVRHYTFWAFAMRAWLTISSIAARSRTTKGWRLSRSLVVTTLVIMALGMWLPYSPLASALGFTHLPRMYWPILMLTLLSYVGLTQVIKVWLLRKQWI